MRVTSIGLEEVLCRQARILRCQNQIIEMTYIGREMKASHVGLDITEAEWEASMTHTAAALDKMRISGREKEEFLKIFSRYKADIVEAPSNLPAD